MIPPSTPARGKKRTSGWPRLARLSLALAALVGLFLVAYAPHAAADSALVQQSSGGSGCPFPPGPPCSLSVSVSFASSVTAGDVVLVAVYDGFSSPTGAPTDTLSSSYSLLASQSDAVGDSLSIYAATLASGGSDTVTVADSSGNSEGLSAVIYEVSGVTATLAQSATGTGTCSGSCSISTSSSVQFLPGAFLLAAMGCNASCTFAGGAGFTSPGGLDFATEYATSGVASPTDFPASVTATTSESWAEAGVALQPLPVTTTTTVTSTTTSTTTSTASVTSTSTTTATSTTTVTTTTTVTLAPTRTTVACSPTSFPVNQRTTCTATVSNVPRSSTTEGVPSGTVSFSSSSSGGSFSTPSCAASGNTLKCTATYGSTSTGKQTITATYPGDATHASSQGTTAVRVQP